MIGPWNRVPGAHAPLPVGDIASPDAWLFFWGDRPVPSTGVQHHRGMGLQVFGQRLRLSEAALAYHRLARPRGHLHTGLGTRLVRTPNFVCWRGAGALSAWRRTCARSSLSRFASTLVSPQRCIAGLSASARPANRIVRSRDAAGVGELGR